MRAALLLLFLSLQLHLWGQQEGPKPNWVSLAPIPEPSAEWQENGVQLLAYDHQVNFAEHASFYRYALLLASPEAVSLYSNIEESYDPSYQQLTFHKIAIIRNGELLSLMEDHEPDFIRLESNRSRLIYDSSMTMLYNLSDIRPGDILTYEFSRKGAYPSFPNHIYSSDYLQTYRAAGSINYRVLLPKGTTLKPVLRNGAPKPKIGSLNGYTEWKWESSNLKALQTEDGEPQSYDPRASVQITNYESWSETNREALKLYQLDKIDLAKLKTEARRIVGSAPAGWDQISSLSLFVQDQIRYLGFENGVHAFQPHDPLQVFNQRYGDCKDKSVLLVGLLRSLGYEAYPIWVNTYRGKRLDDEVPSPMVFNHCVMMAIHNGDTAFVDPTQTNMGGKLPNMSFPQYGKGLVLKAGETKLLKFPALSSGSYEVTDTYGIAADNETASQFRVESYYRGNEADGMRDFFSANSVEAIAEDFTDYYKEYYPSIRFTKLPQIDDDREANVIFVREYYEIDSIWEKHNEDSEKVEFRMPALRSLVTYYEDPDRSAPFSLLVGKNYKHAVRISLPEDWPLANDDVNVEQAEYRYTYKVRPNAAQTEIAIDHHYEVLEDEVAGVDYNRFVRDHDKILENAGYYITRLNVDAASSSSSNSVKWLINLLRIIFVGLFIFLALRLYRLYDPRPEEYLIGVKPQVFGGWLILPLLGLILSPIRIVWDTIELWDETMYANMKVFLDSSSEYYNLAFALVVLLEDLVDLAYAVYAVLLLIMFAKKRTAVPNLMVILYASHLLWLIINLMLLNWVDPASESTEITPRFIGMVIGTLIWIPYFLKSSRVKETFVRTYRPIAPIEQTEVLENTDA